MHTNAATLLNLVQLSVAVASISTGLIGKLSRAPSGPLVLHGRKLSQVSVSTVAELTAAVGDSAVDKILVAAGTYDFTSDMCSGSAVCIDRALTIEAQVPGSVVLDAKSGRRVFEIQSSGTAELRADSVDAMKNHRSSVGLAAATGSMRTGELSTGLGHSRSEAAPLQHGQHLARISMASTVTAFESPCAIGGGTEPLAWLSPEPDAESASGIEARRRIPYSYLAKCCWPIAPAPAPPLCA
jgi:hypothetical protein